MSISVCIPTFNQSEYIEKAIKSAYHQTHQPIEIIVSDDASTDNTRDILNKLLQEIDILKVIIQPKNLGISRNTDECLRAAKGDFVIRLDSDDILHEEYSEKLLSLFKTFPNSGFAHAAVQEIDPKGFFLRKRFLGREVIYQSAEDALKSSVKGYRVAANIIMFRRVALEKVGYIKATTNFAEDYYLSASLAVNGYGNIYLNEILSYYRVWIDTKKVRKKRKLDEIVGFRKVFEEVLEPAFIANNLSLELLTNQRKQLACSHSDCLSWFEYSNEEKQELVQEIKKMSSKKIVSFYCWLNLNGFGVVISVPKKIKNGLKRKLKYLIYSKLKLKNDQNSY